MTRSIPAAAIVLLLVASAAPLAQAQTTTAGSDLVVREVSVSGNFTHGGTLLFRALVANAGGAAVPAGFAVDFRVDGDLVTRHAFPAGMPAGHSTWVETWATAPAGGMHFLDVHADAEDAVAETNESNNWWGRNFRTYVLGVDAYAGPILPPRGLYEGARPSVTAWFGNGGSERGGAPFTVGWLVDGELVAQESWPAGIPPGWEGPAFATLPPLAAGEHEIAFVVDLYGNLTDADASNNRAARTVLVVPPAKVSVDVLELRQHTVRIGPQQAEHPTGRHDATVEVCNGGESPSEPGWVDFSVETTTLRASTALGWKPLEPLAPDACRTFEIAFDAYGAAGDFEFVARIFVPYDGSRGDDESRAQGHRVVEGLGGASVPGRAAGPPDPLGDLVVDLIDTLDRTHERPFTTVVRAVNETCSSGIWNPLSGAYGATCGTLYGRPSWGLVAPCGPLALRSPGQTGYAQQQAYNEMEPWKELPVCASTMRRLEHTAEHADAIVEGPEDEAAVPRPRGG